MTAPLPRLVVTPDPTPNELKIAINEIVEHLEARPTVEFLEKELSTIAYPIRNLLVLTRFTVAVFANAWASSMETQVLPGAVHWYPGVAPPEWEGSAVTVGAIDEIPDGDERRLILIVIGRPARNGI